MAVAESITSGNYRVSLRTNAKQWENGDHAPRGLGSIMLAQTDLSYGGFQFTQLNEKLCRVLATVTEYTQLFKDAGKIFQAGMIPMGINYIPRATVIACDAVKGLFNSAKDLPGDLVRRLIVVIKEVAHLASTVGYSSFPFLQLSTKTAEVAGKVFAGAGALKAVADTCDVMKNGHDFWKLRSVSVKDVEAGGLGFKEGYEEACVLNELNLTKSICSVAGFILGLGVVSAGLAWSPAYAVGTVVISLVGAVCGLSATLYKESRKWEFTISSTNPSLAQSESQTA